MNEFAAWRLGEQRIGELRGQRDRHRPGLVAPGCRRLGLRTAGRRRWQGLSSWLGYRLIGLGCRLAHPVMVPEPRMGN